MFANRPQWATELYRGAKALAIAVLLMVVAWIAAVIAVTLLSAFWA